MKNFAAQIFFQRLLFQAVCSPNQNFVVHLRTLVVQILIPRTFDPEDFKSKWLWDSKMFCFLKDFWSPDFIYLIFSPDFFPWTFVICYFFLSRTFVSQRTFVFRTQFVSRTSFVPQMTCVHQRTFVPWSEFGPRRTFVDLNFVFRGFLFPKKTLAKLGWLLLAPWIFKPSYSPADVFFSHLFVAAMFAQNLFILMACCLYLISCFYQ